MTIIRPPVLPRYSPIQAEMARTSDIKTMLAENVIGTLYSHVQDQLHDELIKIAEQHIAATNTQHKSFIFLGKYYNIEDAPASYPLQLHESVYEQMREYLTQYHQVYNYEIPCISGILKSMFIASDRINDYKQILPEQVHVAFEGFYDGDAVRRFMSPNEIARMQKRIEPFITIMKSRMLQNFVQGHQP